MARTKFRSRARARSAPRRAGLSRTSTTAASTGGGGGLAKYILPMAAVGIVAYLLWPKKAEAAPNVIPEPPPPPPPSRPRKFPNPPAGSGEGLVSPKCAGEPAKCNNGLLIHSVPSHTDATLVAPEDASPTSRHLNTGDVAVILRTNVPDESTPRENRIWAEVINPLGQKGFVSFKDPKGRVNFENITPPSAAPSTGAFAAFHPQQLRLHPHPVRHHRVPGWRGW